jgi:hypothetical protein
MCRMMIVLYQWNFKLVRLFIYYQREMFKKIARLGTFCTQSVNEGLTVEILKPCCFFFYKIPLIYTRCPQEAVVCCNSYCLIAKIVSGLF